MKVAKRFRWEAAHRLPWHTGGCQNLHGHSYYMMVELEGEPDAHGMVIDFKDIKQVLKPLVEAWDHAVLAADYDTELLQVIKLLDSKHFVFPYDTTSENLCQYVADYLGSEAFETLHRHRVTDIIVRVQETETCYAELRMPVGAYAANGNTAVHAGTAP